MLLVMPLLILLGCNSYSLREPFQSDNGLWGYKDETGKIRIEAQFDRAYSFRSFSGDPLGVVLINGKIKVIDKKGEEHELREYGYAFDREKWPYSEWSDDIIIVRLNGKWGGVDKTGKEVVPLRYDRLAFFLNGKRNEGLFRVELNGKWGCVDRTGKEVVPLQYDHVGDKITDAEIIRVKLNGKWGFVDRIGKAVIPIKYDEIIGASDSETVFQLEPTVFRAPSHHSPQRTELQKMLATESWKEFTKRWPWGRGKDEDAKVKLDGKWGLIDRTGNIVVPIKYDRIGSFQIGLIDVHLDGKDGYVDEYGNEYWDMNDPKILKVEPLLRLRAQPIRSDANDRYPDLIKE
ncbi:MAG: WG repeat-containing protein [Holophagaceae bacterium]